MIETETAPTVTAAAVAAWLLTLRGVEEATPVLLTIGRRTWPAARYRQTHPIEPGCRAYDEGRRSVTEEALYVVGMLPPTHKTGREEGNPVHRLPDDARDWYVAGYWPAGGWPRSARQTAADTDGATRTDYHPFGPNWMLRPWTVPEPIDQHEERRRERLPAAVEPVRVCDDDRHATPCPLPCDACAEECAPEAGR